MLLEKQDMDTWSRSRCLQDEKRWREKRNGTSFTPPNPILLFPRDLETADSHFKVII